MKRMLKILTAALCLALLCGAVTGCVSSGLEKPTTSTEPATQPTMPSTAPTEPDDGSRTVLLTTQGGMVLKNMTITIYADAALTQPVKKSSTDGGGMAYFQLEPGSVYYAVSQGRFGFEEPEAVVVTEALTHIQLVSKLVDPEERRYLQLGDIMYDLDCIDLDYKPYRLADAMSAGKHTIFLQVKDDAYLKDEVFLWLKQVHENYADQFDVVLVCHANAVNAVKRKANAFGVTCPIVEIYKNRDWIFLSHVTVVDQYGMLVFSEWTQQINQETMDSLVTYFTREDYQQRLFESGRQLLDYMDSLQAGEEVTYRVTVVDGNGEPLRNIRLKVSYEHDTLQVQTNAQGVASWTMYPRDDIEVTFNRNDLDYRLYIFENEGLFEAGTTEKTMVLRDVETVSYTVRVMDTAGNPQKAPCIRTIPYDQVLWPDENGLIQWEGVELEEPFTVDQTVPNGYLFGGVTREGNVFTIWLDPIVTRYITVVDANGNPLDGVWVYLYEEGNEEAVGSGVTMNDGVAKIYAKAGAFTVEIFDKEFVDGTWYKKEYGTFELEEGVTEITFVVGEPEIEKLY